MDSRSNKEAVQATNDDASASKLSCVKKGYMKDDYVHLFVRRPVRRSPIINRGYFARWAALRKLLNQFLDTEGNACEKGHLKKQILSLGAGFDTTYFQLQDEGKAPHLYVELDFKEVTSKKATLIETCSHLRDKISATASISRESGEVLSDHYKLLPVDLRDIPKLDDVITLAECVLIYLDPDSSRSIVRWTSKTFSTAIFFLYEQIHPDDAFGQQMIRNLESRGCSLLGIHDTPTLQAKENLFVEQGWQRAVAWDMLKVYSDFVEAQERRRSTTAWLMQSMMHWVCLVTSVFLTTTTSSRSHTCRTPPHQHHHENTRLDHTTMPLLLSSLLKQCIRPITSDCACRPFSVVEVCQVQQRVSQGSGISTICYSLSYNIQNDDQPSISQRVYCFDSKKIDPFLLLFFWSIFCSSLC